MLKKHLIKIAVIISLLFHVLLFFSFGYLSEVRLFPLAVQDTDAMEPEKRIEFELVETPENSPDEAPASETNLVSDKNSRARDMNSDPSLPTGNPYLEGDFNIKELPDADQASPTNPLENQTLHDKSETVKQTDAEPEAPDLMEYTHEKFSRKQLMADGAAQSSSPQQGGEQKPVYENTKFSAEELGGFSFNTYEWDFAPYKLEMKRKVEKNVFPPPAFTHMGLISGETILRFKVMPNGEVKDLEVLKYTGHEALMETSVKAIQISSPFRNLPADFPENYLEVTASFTYFIRR